MILETNRPSSLSDYRKRTAVVKNKPIEDRRTLQDLWSRRTTVECSWVQATTGFPISQDKTVSSKTGQLLQVIQGDLIADYWLTKPSKA
jgi:hypothetical protein